MNPRKTLNVKCQLEAALAGVQIELSKAKRGEEAIDSIDRLYLIFNQLSAMIETLCSESPVPVWGLWRIVTDTWPFQSKLSEQIVASELAYEKLINRKEGNHPQANQSTGDATMPK